MIYLINKYHKTAAGEAAEAIKKSDADEVKAKETALKDFYQYAANYMGDSSVLKWSIAVVDAVSSDVIKRDGYEKPVEQTEAE